MNNLSLHEQMAQFYEEWRAIDKLYDRYAKSVGLTYMGLCILETIYDTPEACTQKLICEETHLPKQSVNVIIRGFLDQGYLEMQEIDTDRRNKAIRLTPSGRKYAEQVVGRLSKIEEDSLGRLSPEQWSMISGLLKTIRNSFEVHLQSSEPK